MKKFYPLNRMDLLFLLGAGLFFFSCIATTLQTARTKAPGQVELSAGYLNAQSTNGSEDGGSTQLIGMNARLGVAENLDLGFEHTLDVTKDNDALFNTIWGDVKYQFSNHSNENKKLTFSSGLLKGYVYKEDAQVHITTLPLYFSLPVNNRVMPTFMYRYGLISDGFFPNSDSFDDPRHTFMLGIEYALKEPDAATWIPKFAASIGTMQSFDGEDSGLFLFNFGFKIDSPFGQKE
ncbi:hypothetical protein [Maribellus sp. YY47]|uniref:hypothetical protein n=1 Tax=Maribellus sp. YY47 TaxID=2929486 RepID=UPI002001A4C1|nr:hypothetical protein [Maribellus sp. YY47]MCK3685308.1 hypothetical protein [Maribellus sp. YY47]